MIQHRVSQHFLMPANPTESRYAAANDFSSSPTDFWWNTILSNHHLVERVRQNGHRRNAALAIVTQPPKLVVKRFNRDNRSLGNFPSAHN
jgi:hypothetical protein